MEATKPEIITRLQRDILLLSGYKQPANTSGLPSGLRFMQRHFPNGVFPVGAIHEFLCHQPEDLAATGGFISGILSACMQVRGIVLWVSPRKNVFPPSLRQFNIEPGNIIFIHAAHEKEVLWVTEEALKCESLCAVVTEMRDLNFTNSRRFQLAVEQSKVTGFILNQNINTTTNACVSRWQINALPSIVDSGLPGVGHPRWQVALKKIRNGKPGNWEIEWLGNAFRQVIATAIQVQREELQKQTG